MSTFIELLDKHRERRGLSKNALAQAANLSGSYISLLLRGEKKAPSPQTIAGLTKALGLDSEETEELAKAAGVNPADLNLGDRMVTKRLRGGISPTAAGLDTVYADLSEDLIEERILEAEERIRIQDTWIPDPRRFRKAFIEASKKGVHIEVLILNHESKFANQRGLDLQYHTGQYVSEQIKEDIHEFEFLDDAGVHIEVRLYDSLPSIQQIIYDQCRFIGFFLHGERSDLAPQLEIRDQETILGKFFEEEFERVWKASEKNIIIPKQSSKPSPG